MSRSPTGHGFWMPGRMGGDERPGTGGESPQASACASFPCAPLCAELQAEVCHTAKLVAICFVLRGWNWNSAAICPYSNQHLAVTRQT